MMSKRRTWGRAVALAVALGGSIVAGACASAETSSGPTPFKPSGLGDACDGNCTGCCKNGKCIPADYQSDDSCGSYASECSSCEEGRKCSNAQCVADNKVCSRFNCAGCCDDEGVCHTEAFVWETCGQGGESCKPCERMGQCNQGVCRNDFWSIDAVVDLYIDKITASSCTDVGSPPDLVLTVTVNGKTYTKACPEDVSVCSPSFKITGLKLQDDIAVAGVKFEVGDTDLNIHDPCFSGELKPVERDLIAHTQQVPGGTITYRVLPSSQ